MDKCAARIHDEIGKYLLLHAKRARACVHTEDDQYYVIHVFCWYYVLRDILFAFFLFAINMTCFYFIRSSYTVYRFSQFEYEPVFYTHLLEHIFY